MPGTDRQPSQPSLLLFADRFDDRIDEHLSRLGRVIAVFGRAFFSDGKDDQPRWHMDLGRGQSGPVGVFERLQHV